jgi:hypothetical protein
MAFGDVSAPVPLTSSSTTIFGRILPAVVTTCAGVVAVMVWLSPEPGMDTAVKWVVLGTTVAVSAVVYRLFGRFQHVWVEGEYLLIGDARRGFRVRLQDVQELKETRFEKLKWIKLRLAHSTPLGSTIRFIPRGHRAWLVPWAASPLAEELRRRIEAAKEEGGA